jgi:ubiquinol-cytochrome c reductase iron-sulfur subunit
MSSANKAEEYIVNVTRPDGTSVSVPYTQDHHHRPIEHVIQHPHDSVDTAFDDVQRDVGKSMDPTGRNFAYVMQGGARFMYASMIRFGVIKVVASLSASADVMAAAKVEVDLSKIYDGTTLTVKWRGKPVFIRNRTQKDIDAARGDDSALMRDPIPDSMRVKNPKWLVVLGICTHLGCVPLPNSGNWNGWFCPCHGSHYDTSGRIRLGPAPLNLEVPQYSFLGDKTLILG